MGRAKWQLGQFLARPLFVHKPVSWKLFPSSRPGRKNRKHPVPPLNKEVRRWYKSNEAQPMKRVRGLLYVAFPAVLLVAQTSRPESPANGTSTLGTPSVEQLRWLPTKFPPAMMLSSSTTGRLEVKFAHSYCVSPNLDRKSLSVKRCEPVPLGIRLVSPFPATAPENKPAK